MAFGSWIQQIVRSANKRLHLALRGWHDLRFREGSLIHGRYLVRRKLGEGSYGVTYVCTDTVADRACVLKRVTPVRGGRTRAELIYAREVSILQRLQHPAIPTLYETFRYRNHLCFTMELMPGASLDCLLFQQHVRFSEYQSLRVLRELLPIVSYLHAIGILHRDISIANVLLDGEFAALIDLGLARELVPAGTGHQDPLEIEPGDPSEKVLRRQIDVTSDFYALGHLLLFLLYSTYTAREHNAAADDIGWERELDLHPGTKKLLRRLLLAEQPFGQACEIIHEVDQLLKALHASN
ncbi:serine/threonine protein kinase [Paenibacillus xerothermodurans]|nr:protein kinase [Paenibacillus xerothermodurans]